MQKIAILHCRKASDVCTGASCFKAYHLGVRAFSVYGDDKPELAAFFDCGGCGIDRETDPGMTEKMERLVSEGVERVHAGVCIGAKCPHREEIFAMVRRYHLDLVLGTH